MIDVPRSGGPTVVYAGPQDAPAVLVLDPAGLAKHDDLPPGWKRLADRRRVVWCRLPAHEALAESRAALNELAHGDAPIDLVTSGPTAEVAMDLAMTRPGAVRSVLLIDPGSPDDRFPSTVDAMDADASWEKRTRWRVEEVEQAGVAVRIVGHSAGGSRDRVPPPVPLGHPDVVEVISEALREFDGVARQDPPG